MGIIRRADTPCPLSKQEMSAVRCPLTVENFHIFTQGQKRKHFHQKICPLRACALGNDKVRNFFAFRTTLSQSIAQKNIEFKKYNPPRPSFGGRA